MSSILNEPAGQHPALAALPPAGFDARRIEWVLSLYDEPHRHYHNRSHVAEMLQAAGKLDITLTAAQALAILFHDAVYVPDAARGANEVLSARLLRIGCGPVADDIVGRAEAIILDTIEHRARSEEARIVLDLDLMRLAAPPDEFERYSWDLVQERRTFAPVQDDEVAWWVFCRDRRPFFEEMLARNAIFTEPAVHAVLERPARANLQASLQADAMTPSVKESGSREKA